MKIPPQIIGKITKSFNIGDKVYMDKSGNLYNRRSKNRAFVGWAQGPAYEGELVTLSPEMSKKVQNALSKAKIEKREII